MLLNKLALARQLIFVTGLTLLCAVSIAGPASSITPGAVEDQAYTPTNCQSSGVNGVEAQTFMAGITGELSEVRLGLISSSGFPDPAPYDVQIVATTGGLPDSSNVLAQSDPEDQSALPAFAPGGTNPMQGFSLTPHPAIVAGTEYAILLRSLVSYPGPEWNDNPSSNPCATGAEGYPGGGSGGCLGFGSPCDVASIDASRDFAFETYVVTQNSPPSAPANVVAAAGDATIAASWTAPSSEGASPITGYDISATSSSSSVSTSVGGGTFSATLSGLTNGEAYVVTVTARNAAGPGDPSAPSNPVTPQSGAAAPASSAGSIDASGGTVAVSSSTLDTSVSVPAGTTGGSVTIAEGTVTQTAPSGYSFLGTQINIRSTAPTTASNPLRITFTIDGSQLNGEAPDTLQIFRTEDGGPPALVPDCTDDPTTVAVPDPCIPRSSRVWAGSDAQLTIVTSSASLWNVAPLPPVGVHVGDSGYSPLAATSVQSARVDWTFASSKLHSVTDALRLGPSGAALYDSGPARTGSLEYRFAAAGSYTYHSTVKGDNTSSFAGQVLIPVQIVPSSVHLSATPTITWSSATLAGYVFDVQYSFRKSAASGWGSWIPFRKGTTQTEGSFTPTKAGTYRFEARLRNVSTGKTSFWSPDVLLHVT
jgi:hypothetical protein